MRAAIKNDTKSYKMVLEIRAQEGWGYRKAKGLVWGIGNENETVPLRTLIKAKRDEQL